MSRDMIRGWLETHPRVTTATFTLLVLLVQAGSALAEGAGGSGG